jgi:hypothetical protein
MIDTVGIERRGAALDAVDPSSGAAFIAVLRALAVLVAVAWFRSDASPTLIPFLLPLS